MISIIETIWSYFRQDDLTTLDDLRNQETRTRTTCIPIQTTRILLVDEQLYLYNSKSKQSNFLAHPKITFTKEYRGNRLQMRI